MFTNFFSALLRRDLSALAKMCKLFSWEVVQGFWKKLIWLSDKLRGLCWTFPKVWSTVKLIDQVD